MKRQILMVCMAAAMLFSLTPMDKAHAQLVLPTNPDIFWYTDTGYIYSLNTAMIDYMDTSQPNPMVNSLLVSDYQTNGSPTRSGGIVFRDRISGFTVHWDFGNPPFYLGHVGASPDIIVGNSINNPEREFIVAAAYIDAPPLMPPAFVRARIDYFTVTYIASGVFTVINTGTTFFPLGTEPTTIHIDIIAEAGNTTATGYPWCDKFAVTWDRTAPPLASLVYAWHSSLNAPFLGTVTPGLTPGVQQISPTIPPSPGAKGCIRPDVAAVQRQACSTCVVEDWAMITYIDHAFPALNLYYDEWNISTLTLMPVGLWWTDPVDVDYPRIDGPDDYNINNPVGATTSYFKIAALTQTTNSYTFDNLLGPGAFWDNATPYTYAWQGPPTVAFGPDNGTQYAVTHYSHSGFVDDVFMEPIDWAIPNALALSPLLASNWFKVNTTAPLFVNGANITSISTPCNRPFARTLIAWSSFDFVSQMSTVHYKLTGYGGGNGYAFKEAPATEPVAKMGVPLKVFPNPATESITTTARVGSVYTIINMLGRAVIQGMVVATGRAIDISALPPGNYTLKVGDEREKFVKQ